MNYQFNMGIWNAVFAVPNDLVDKHIKLAEKEHLKVILWMLRHASEPFSLNQLALDLAITADAAEEALLYWVDRQMIQVCGNDIAAASSAATIPVAKASNMPVVSDDSAEVPASEPPVAQQKPIESEPPVHRKPKRLPKPDSMYIATRINASSELQYLIQEIESILGKALSPALSSVVVAAYEDYALPAEVIIMLIHYVKNVGKTSTSYIDSVARDWSESQIFSLEAAEDKLKELNSKRQAWKRIETLIGVFHRSPSKREEEAADRWLNQWHIQDELLSEAYERCVDQTGKFSIPYINKILEKWYKSGIKTLSDIQTLEKRKAQPAKKEKSYDLDELDDLSFFNPPEDIS